MRYRQVLTDPIIDNNPVTTQILGICSALAVTRTMLPALIMAASVIVVLAVANTAMSLMRNIIPGSVRLILEMTIIASTVIIIDEALKAYTPDISATLSVFVGLIITNCIVLGRTETYALNNNVWASALDGLGNGLGYGILLLVVAVIRELWGSGALLDRAVFATESAGGWFVPNQFMALPASAFFIVALIIWVLRTLRTPRDEP